MKPTTVWTWGSKNDKFYSTTSKLYLGYGDNSSIITVGANKVDANKTENAAVNNGIRVDFTEGTGAADSPYTIPYETGNRFWLRSPYASLSNIALNSITGKCMGKQHCQLQPKVRPCLRAKSGIFASTAVPATASSALSDGLLPRCR